MSYGNLMGDQLEKALFFANASSLAYLDDPPVDTKYTQMGFSNPINLADETTGTNCFVAKIQSSIVVPIRGTSSVENLDTNVHLHLANAYRGRVHSGYLTAAEALVELVIGAIERFFINGDETVSITGHSLGGAVGVLLGKALVIRAEAGLIPRCYIPTRIVTFGTPKMGDKNFANNCPLKDCLTQFVNEGDLVPLMPPFAGWGYVHINGRPHVRLSKGHLKNVNLNASLKKAIIKKCRKLWPKLRSVISDTSNVHSIERYVEYLETNLAVQYRHRPPFFLSSERDPLDPSGEQLDDTDAYGG